MYTKHVPHSRQWGYSRAQVRRCLYPVKQPTFKYKDTDSKYMHERDSDSEKCDQRNGNNSGISHSGRLVKEGLSQPLSKGLKVVREGHSSRRNRRGKDPEAGTTLMRFRKASGVEAGSKENSKIWRPIKQSLVGNRKKSGSEFWRGHSGQC